MKILHSIAGGEAGGAEMAYVDLAIAQKEAGLNVIAACRPNSHRVPILKEAGVTVYEFPYGGVFDFTTRRGLKTLIEKERPDVVQCWMSRAAKLTPKVKGIPKIARLGGYYNLKYYRDVDHFIGNTPDICRWLVEEQGVASHNVTHINNFAEIEPIKASVTKADLDTDESDFVFLTLARLHPVKGLDTALKALASLPDSIILWIAGDGPEKDNLQQLAKDLGVQDRVRWLGWRTDRAALLQACDAVLFPSRYEPFGTTFVQAWAMERPLVTTASQGPSQYVTDYKNALMTPIDDVKAMATAMQKITQDSHLSATLVRNGYASFQKMFKKCKVIKDYVFLYNSLNNLTDKEL